MGINVRSIDAYVEICRFFGFNFGSGSSSINFSVGLLPQQRSLAQVRLIHLIRSERCHIETPLFYSSVLDV